MGQPRSRTTMQTRKAILLSDVLATMGKRSTDFPMDEATWELARAAAENLSVSCGGPRMGKVSDVTREMVRCLMVRAEAKTTEDLFAGLKP